MATLFNALLLKTSASEVIGRDLFWVGGSASWNGTAASKWSLTSGGTGGEAEPTSIDNVHFDANSGAVTVTIATTTANCRNLDFTGFTGTLAGSTAISIFGSLTLVSGMTRSYTGAITFASTFTGRTITSNTKALASSVTFNGVGGGWQLQDDLNIGISSITLTNGSLNTNGKTVTAGLGISSNNSNVRSLICGASTFNFSNGGLTLTTSTNLTFSASLATFNIQGANNVDLGSTAATITALNFTGNALNANSPSLINRSNSDVTIGTLTRTNSSTLGILLLSGNYTITNTLTAVGADVRNARITIFNANPSNTCQITATGTTKTFTNVDFYGITAVGNTPWTGTSIGDCGGNTGITFDTPVTRYLNMNGGNGSYISTVWATSSGGSVGTAVSNPLPQDTIIIDNNSFSGAGITLSLDSAPPMPTLDFTNATNSPTVSNNNQARIFGNLKLISSMNLSGAGTLIFNKWSGTTTLTTAGISIANNIRIETGGTFVLADALTSTSAGATTLTAGTFNDGNFNISATQFQISATPLSVARTFNKGTGTYTLTSAGGAWNILSSTNLTFTDSGTIKYTNNSSSSKTFVGGGLSYNIIYNATAGTGVMIYTGNNTYSQLQCDAGRTNQFVGGSTHTVTTFNINGTAGNNTVLSRSSGSGTYTFNLTQIQTIDRETISNCNVTGNTLTCTNSTDGGGNTGSIVFM